jgi:hypothetical protein
MKLIRRDVRNDTFMEAIKLRIVAGGLLVLIVSSGNMRAEPLIVGENNNLTCQWDRSDGPPITNFVWALQGYAVSNFYVASDLSTGLIIEAFPITNSNVEFCWADKGNKKVSCDIISMGQKLRADAHFNVIAPTVDFIGTINGRIAYDTNYVFSRDGIKCLHFGGSISNGVQTHGIDLIATNANLNGIDQQTSFGFMAVQTVGNFTYAFKKSDGSIISTNKTGLDGSYPYDSMGEGDGVLTYDSPGVGCTSSYLTNFVQFSLSGSFRQVLMFQCFGGMPVPMKEILWNFSGTVSFTNGDWILTSSNASITANNRATTTFPNWTNFISIKP